MFKGEKTLVFWAGLFVLGLASWGLFASIWSSMRTLLDMYLYYCDIENNLPAAASSVVFVLIGIYMMKLGVTKQQTLASSRKVLFSFRGEKTSVFWVGLNVTSLAFVIGFAEIWNSTRIWIDMRILLLDHISIIAGTIAFVLIGLFMMKSGVREKKPLTQS